MSMLYITGVIIVVVICGFGVVYFVKKRNSKGSQVNQKKAELEALTQLIATNAQRMKLGTEEDIKKIINIVLNTLDSISDLPDTVDIKEKISKATIIAINMCKVAYIEVDRAKAFFISRLITIAYNAKYNKKTDSQK